MLNFKAFFSVIDVVTPGRSVPRPCAPGATVADGVAALAAEFDVDTVERLRLITEEEEEDSSFLDFWSAATGVGAADLTLLASAPPLGTEEVPLRTLDTEFDEADEDEVEVEARRFTVAAAGVETFGRVAVSLPFSLALTEGVDNGCC